MAWKFAFKTQLRRLNLNVLETLHSCIQIRTSWSWTKSKHVLYIVAAWRSLKKFCKKDAGRGHSRLPMVWTMVRTIFELCNMRNSNSVDAHSSTDSDASDSGNPLNADANQQQQVSSSIRVPAGDNCGGTDDIVSSDSDDAIPSPVPAIILANAKGIYLSYYDIVHSRTNNTACTQPRYTYMPVNIECLIAHLVHADFAKNGKARTQRSEGRHFFNAFIRQLSTMYLKPNKKVWVNSCVHWLELIITSVSIDSNMII